MVGHRSSREWRRGSDWSDSTLADSGDSSSRGGEASVGDHGECDLSSCCGALDYGSCPGATRRNELAWQELDRLEGWSSCSRKLARNQLDIERLRRGVLRAVACLVDDLWTGGYRAVGRGHLRSRKDELSSRRRRPTLWKQQLFDQAGLSGGRLRGRSLGNNLELWLLLLMLLLKPFHGQCVADSLIWLDLGIGVRGRWRAGAGSSSRLPCYLDSLDTGNGGGVGENDLVDCRGVGWALLGAGADYYYTLRLLVLSGYRGCQST